ncbi:YheC/YheD family protein [Paenibacillus chartarius]|uniref:YheC/YheD family protein n=1 Tax=Paenibacillus chartarius TaxID=747481 RepID=A0ABV6DN57_9BACL
MSGWMRSTGSNAFGTVGVLVAGRPGEPGFAGETFHRELVQAGIRLGIRVVIVTPQRLLTALRGELPSTNIDGTMVPAYVMSALGGWRLADVPLPDYIYDRHFAANAAEQSVYREALRELSAAPGRVKRLLGAGLPGKRAVQRMLAKDAELSRYLTPTELFRSPRRLLALLDRYGELFLKPDGGSQGRGAFHIGLGDGSDRITVCGRTASNERFAYSFSERAAFIDWIHRRVQARPYLIQPYLTLYDRAGSPFDIRCLVQKDDSGQWQRTGMAVRRGVPGSVTANLHGGGEAEPAEPFLASEFGKETAKRIEGRLQQLSEIVPIVLESQCGRLVELGIDFGIDRSGRIWLLEVNSKPGRSCFARIGSPHTRRASVENPLRYARSLLRRGAQCSNAILASQTL